MTWSFVVGRADDAWATRTRDGELIPQTYEVTEEFGYRDHVGGVVVDRVTDDVHGVTWGSRRLIRWDDRGRVRDVALNGGHFIDYQDCAYVASRKQLCSGVAGLPTASGGSYELGGLALTASTDCLAGGHAALDLKCT
jgi:Family of unknown function (DUF6454)